MVFKTTFGQSQRRSLIRGTLGVENDERNNINFANKFFFYRQDVLILGGLNSGISLYTKFAKDFLPNDHSSKIFYINYFHLFSGIPVGHTDR